MNSLRLVLLTLAIGTWIPLANAQEPHGEEGEESEVDESVAGRKPGTVVLSGEREHERPSWPRNGAAEAEGDDEEGEGGEWETPRGVTIISTGGKGAVGIRTGPFVDGRVNLAEGSLGELNLDVLRAEQEWSAGAGIVPGGVAANAQLEARAILVGLQAETKVAVLGDPNSMTYAAARGEGRAFVGADVEAVGGVSATRNGVRAGAVVEAFAGAKAQGEVFGSATLCGVSINTSGEAEASVGIGGEVSGIFEFDWAEMRVKVGGEVAGTLGVGAGVGGSVEISLDKLVRNPGMAADCVKDGLRAGGQAIAGAFGSMKNAVGDGLGAIASFFGGGRSKEGGNNVVRTQHTRVAGVLAPSSSAAERAQGAGMLRD